MEVSGGEHREGLDRIGDLGWWFGSDISVGGEFGVVKALNQLSSRLGRKKQSRGQHMAISYSPTPNSINNRSGQCNAHAATITLRGRQITDSAPTGDARSTPSIRHCHTSKFCSGGKAQPGALPLDELSHCYKS